ncbi:MAG TPA: helix-turn-helix domain-containing protein [Jatrophihabitans sp.]
MKHSDPITPILRVLDDLDLIPAISAVALADPDAPGAAITAGTVLLGVGVGTTAAERLVAGASGSSAAALVLRPPDGPDSAVARALAEQARQAGVNLYWLADSVSWDAALHRLMEHLAPLALNDGSTDLADLAQTIASLTGGLVTIEDTSARVLAYSRSNDEVDDLRRLSILGRSGPPEYLALLREWGVYDRLATPEDVVEIEPHPESGVQRRLAVGVFAGQRQLGTIWVQQGPQPFGTHAKQALLGAARVTAAHLIGGRAASSSVTERGGTQRGGAERGRWDAPGSDGLLLRLLADPDEASVLARTGLGRAAEHRCLVAVFALDASDDPIQDRAATDELGSLVAVQAAAFRRSAMVTRLDGRIYLLVPSVESIRAALPTVRQAAGSAQRHLARQVIAALGPVVDSADQAPRSRSGADLALTTAGPTDTSPAPRRRSTPLVITFDQARPELIVAAAVQAVAARPDLADPAVGASAGTAEARTLLHYLDYGSDVAKVANLEKVHVTTVRHRLRKIVESLDTDLANPDQRLAMQLQLRAELRTYRMARK